jgi:protein-tyrosine phosphatase
VRILFVCLGNICRSPTAEGVLRAIAAREAPGLVQRVDSAGTADYHIGSAPDPRTRAAAQRRGYDLSMLRARQAGERDFTDFDLLLAMDRANLAALRALAPDDAARGRTALFLEYARGDGGRDVGSAFEVPDPYYGGTADFDAVLDLVERGSRALLARLQRESRG